MRFRDRLLATLRAVQPVLEQPGIMVVGSEVPNLREPGAAATLVVSKDIDLGVPVSLHGVVKSRLHDLAGLHPAPDEPSVWLPVDATLLEVNFVGIDSRREPGDAYVLDDDELPLLVFGALSLLREGEPALADGMRVPLPRPAGLLLEKLVTERTGDKGDRDLLVALGLLLTMSADDLAEVERLYAGLTPEHRHAARSNLTLLSLMKAVPAMPDPESERERVVRLLERLEAAEPPGT